MGLRESLHWFRDNAHVFWRALISGSNRIAQERGGESSKTINHADCLTSCAAEGPCRAGGPRTGVKLPQNTFFSKTKKARPCGNTAIGILKQKQLYFGNTMWQSVTNLLLVLNLSNSLFETVLFFNVLSR